MFKTESVVWHLQSNISRKANKYIFLIHTMKTSIYRIREYIATIETELLETVLLGRGCYSILPGRVLIFRKKRDLSGLYETLVLINSKITKWVPFFFRLPKSAYFLVRITNRNTSTKCPLIYPLKIRSTRFINFRMQ